MTKACVAVAVLVWAASRGMAAEIELQRVATGDIGVLLTVTARWEGRPLRLLIDSGATHNLLAPWIVAQPNAPSEAVRLHSAAGTLVGRRVSLQGLQIGAQTLDGQTAVQVDLAPLLGPLAGEVDGVLGVPSLDGRRIAVDLQRDRIDFDAEPAAKGAPLQRVGRLPVLAVDMQGQNRPLLVDTGAAGGIVRLSRWFGIAGLWLAPRVEVAGVERLQVPVADLPGTALGRALPDGIAGTLGMAVLDGCRFTLDLAADRLVLHDCAKPAVPGGFGLQWQERGGALTLVNVWPGSPAQRAGLRAGDRVITINGATAPANAPRADALLMAQAAIVLEMERGGQGFKVALERSHFLPALPP
jgi:hypothetical protein